MGLRNLARRSSARAWPDDQLVYALPGAYGLTAAAYSAIGGVEDALKNAATYACIRVMVDALSRTPIDVVREVRGSTVPVDPTPKIIASPSGIVAPDVWRAQLGFSVMTDGNVFAQIAEVDTRGRPSQMELLDPFKVMDRRVEKGRAVVRIGSELKSLYPFGDVWHMPGDLIQPGTPFAISPVTYASKLIGTSLSAEDFSFRFFADGGHPSYLLQSSQSSLTEEQAAKAKESWHKATRGSREPAVLGSGWKVEQFTLDPRETQFIDLMRFCTEQACRVFGVPPTMIFSSVSGQHMTYANVTQADLHFLKYALEGKFTRMEAAFTDLLPGNSYSAPSVANTKAVMRRTAILKADVAARYAAYEIGIRNRFLTVNQVRAAENDPPFGPEYDEPIVPPFGPTPGPLGATAVPDTTAADNVAPSPDDDAGI